MNFDEIIKRSHEVLDLKSDKQLADILGISQQNFSNKKKKGTLFPEIVRVISELHPEVNLDWVVNGRGSKVFANFSGNPAAKPNPINIPLLTEIIDTIEDALDRHGKSMTPSKKAAAIAMLYAKHSGETTTAADDADRIADMVGEDE